MNDVNLYFTAMHRYSFACKKYIKISSTCTTHSIQLLHSHSFPTFYLPSLLFTQRWNAWAQSTSCYVFFPDCRQLSCRCIRDVNFGEKHILFAKKKFVLWFIHSGRMKEGKLLKKNEALCIIATEKFALYSIEIWYYELYLKASLCMVLFSGTVFFLARKIWCWCLMFAGSFHGNNSWVDVKDF